VILTQASVARTGDPGPQRQPHYIAYEGFEYMPGEELPGLSGGTGWAEEWHEHGPGTRTVVGSNGLTFGRLLTSGYCLETTSGNPIGDDRTLTTPLGMPGTTVYLSLLVRPLDPIGSGSFGGYFVIDFGSISIGKSRDSSFLGMEHSGSGGLRATNIRVEPNRTYFLVVRARFTDGNSTFDLFVDPTPGQPLPSVPSATKSDENVGIVGGINVGASTRCQFGEIRIGYTYADVSPTR